MIPPAIPSNQHRIHIGDVDRLRDGVVRPGLEALFPVAREGVRVRATIGVCARLWGPYSTRCKVRRRSRSDDVSIGFVRYTSHSP